MEEKHSVNVFFIFLTGNFSWTQVIVNSSPTISNSTQNSTTEPNITYFSIQSLKQVKLTNNIKSKYILLYYYIFYNMLLGVNCRCLPRNIWICYMVDMFCLVFISISRCFISILLNGLSNNSIGIECVNINSVRNLLF